MQSVRLQCLFFSSKLVFPYENDQMLHSPRKTGSGAGKTVCPGGSRDVGVRGQGHRQTPEPDGSDPDPEKSKVPQFHPRIEISLVLEDDSVDEVIDALIATLRTGNLGDGKIFVQPVEEAIRVRTGEKGTQALY